MASGWLYNTGNPHAADARQSGFGQVPKYYRLTMDAFSVIDPRTKALDGSGGGPPIHFPPQEVILKRVKYETDARISDIPGFCEWWMVPPDREKLINFNHVTDTQTPIAEWERVNPGEDWQDYYPRVQWWVRPALANEHGADWVAVNHLFADPGDQIPYALSPAGVAFERLWLAARWSPFGRNELLYFDDPATSPRAQVEAYWP